MKKRYFKNNKEYFSFINKNKDNFDKCKVEIKNNKIKVIYNFLEDKNA